MERRLAEAEARGETAEVLASRAERVQEQQRVAAMTAEAAVSLQAAGLSCTCWRLVAGVCALQRCTACAFSASSA